ncbi:MAG: site-specific DNA-methyltransferase, partial [Saprospiraceae bacterium]|nr:site-specific DNA-methyltransferase [Saprospiraceae bacterium]
NFVANIIWQKKYTQSNDAKFFSDTHDFIACYSKSKKFFKLNLLPRTEEQNERYSNQDNDSRGPWMTQPLHAKSGKDFEFEYTFKNGVKWKPPVGTFPRFSIESLNRADYDNRIWFGKNGDAVPRLKKYLYEMKDGVISKTLWMYDEVGSNDDAKREIKNIFNNNPFSTPKPSKLIERIVHLSTNKNSIILDSFAGSGTTAHAVLNINKQDGGKRKFICIEMEDYAETITAERVKRVIKKMQSELGLEGLKDEQDSSEIQKSTNQTNPNLTFDFYELGQSMFLEDGNLNELVGVEKIRQYVYYTETKQSLNHDSPDLYDGHDLKNQENQTNPKNQGSDSFLGKHNDTAYYFHYEQDEVTTLDHAFLATMKTKAEQYVIYADNCLLTKEFMTKHHIIFKKIPRDITRF